MQRLYVLEACEKTHLWKFYQARSQNKVKLLSGLTHASTCNLLVYGSRCLLAEPLVTNYVNCDSRLDLVELSYFLADDVRYIVKGGCHDFAHDLIGANQAVYLQHFGDLFQVFNYLTFVCFVAVDHYKGLGHVSFQNIIFFPGRFIELAFFIYKQCQSGADLWNSSDFSRNVLLDFTLSIRL